VVALDRERLKKAERVGTGCARPVGLVVG
jgi:hypothetical protein